MRLFADETIVSTGFPTPMSSSGGWDVWTCVVNFIGIRDLDAMCLVNRHFRDLITTHPQCIRRRVRFLENMKRVLDFTLRQGFVSFACCHQHYVSYARKMAMIESRNVCLLFYRHMYENGHDHDEFENNISDDPDGVPYMET